MADDDNSNLFGLNDSSLGILDDGSASADINTDNSYTSDDAQFESSGWDFPDAIPFAFDAASSAPAMPPTFTTSVWDSPPFAFDEPSPPQAASNTSPANNNDPMFLFGSPLVNSPQRTRPQQPAAVKTMRQPATTLTPAAEEKLRNIAMPPHLQYHSPKSASTASSPDAKDGSSSKSSKAHAKKRKVSEDLDDDDDEDEDGRPIKKTSHNMIEKRYRNNLNDKIAALRDSVPSLRIMSKSARGEDTTEDRQELHGLTPAHKLNKATVLSKATEYIRHLEKRYNRLQDENNTMRARIAAFEKLFMAGAMNGSIGQTQPPPTPMQYAAQEQRKQSQQNFSKAPSAAPSASLSTNPSQDGSNGPSGMIQVPDDMKRIIAAQMASGQAYPIPQQPFRQAPQQVMVQQQQQQQEQPGMWANASPYVGKLMVGSLAGLMILEAAREGETSNDEPQGRGLFALPLHLLSRSTTGLLNGLDFSLGGYHFHTSLKLLLVLGTFLWVFVPSLFAAGETKPKKPQQVSMLQPAPSLASPIHVRRQAWLTAAQSVWIPRNNFVLEASALLLKVAKVSLLKLIGAHGYKLLSGATADQEGARTKAWSIALDSQLAGGDVEINQSRLIITFLASATLPDTPIRLMLKSLHIRVLLWDLSRNQWKLGAINSLAERLARARWNEACHLNRLLAEHRRATSTQHEDELPDHLAQLVEQECEDVLNPRLVQRAYNLAFNKDTRHGVENPIDGMDSVVEDMAIVSPMDAVSAWFSTQVLNEALSATLERGEETPASRDRKLELAIHTAPVGSVAQARAVVARAALSDEHRGSNLAVALQTVGSHRHDASPATSSPMVQAVPSNLGPDIHLALRCATAIAHLRRPDASLDDLRCIEYVAMPKDASSVSLLASAAVMELIERLYENKAAAEAHSCSLERLAGGLRLWIGGSAGEACGLGAGIRHCVVDRCLGITKSLVGMELDTGYGSLSEEEEEEEVDLVDVES